VAGDGGSLADLQLRGFFAAYGWRQSPRRVSDRSKTKESHDRSARAERRRPGPTMRGENRKVPVGFLSWARIPDWALGGAIIK